MYKLSYKNVIFQLWFHANIIFQLIHVLISSSSSYGTCISKRYNLQVHEFDNTRILSSSMYDMILKLVLIWKHYHSFVSLPWQLLTDGAIKNLAFCCRYLTSLNLAGCKLVRTCSNSSVTQSKYSTATRLWLINNIPKFCVIQTLSQTSGWLRFRF